MGQDKETKKLLLDSAKTEFMEKGFEKASLRTICKNVGVTTGALYFFFTGKEDLFAAIVEEPYKDLMKMLSEHYEEHKAILENFSEISELTNRADHDSFELMLVQHLYANYDAFLLLLTKSQGTRFEKCIDIIVEITEKSFIFMAEKMADKISSLKVDRYMCHWLTHMSIDAFIQLIIHESEEKCALRYMKKIMDFILKGWTDLVLTDGNLS